MSESEFPSETIERLQILGLPDVAGEVMELRRTVLRLEHQYSVLLREHLEKDNASLEAAIDSMRIELDEMRAERDEARWEVCELSGNGSIDSAIRNAKDRGWDCFEED
jgi:hypothetical protein